MCITTPVISVIMSVYKEPLPWIAQSIESILKQSFTNFEFLLIIDNPCDNDLNNFLETYKQSDNRITLIKNPVNLGLTKSLNRGIRMAKGDYIARMDSDDISEPERFEKQLDILRKHPEYDVCGSYIKFIGERKGIKRYPTIINSTNLLLESPFAHPSVMIRRRSLGELRYNEHYRVSQDFDLWVRMYGRGLIFYNINECLLNYRVSDCQIMARQGHIQQEISKRIRRQAYIYYTKLNGLVCYLDYNSQMTFSIKNKISMQLKDDIINDFLFYAYISIPRSLFVKLLHILIDGDFMKMSFINIIKIIYYDIKSVNASKF